MILTLPVSERLMYAPREEHKQVNTIYRLKDFQGLQSLTKPYKPILNGHMAGDDNAFWEIKLFLEHRIKDNGGEGSFVDYMTIYSHAMHFYEWKDTSTCKAKIRNIWRWYESRDWQYHILKKSSKTEKEILMTRQEHAKRMTAGRVQKAKNTVYQAMFGLEAFEYKKADNSYNISKIARDFKMSPLTVRKYVKCLKKEEIEKKN